MIVEQALIQSCWLPEDKAQVELDLPDFMQATVAGHAHLGSVYSATHPALIAGIDALLSAGVVPVLYVVDHTQGCNAKQAALWSALISKHGHDWVSFGSSPIGAKYINHSKILVANAPLPDAPPGAALNSLTAYQDWRSATAAGIPAVWDGSFNFDITAESQVNDVNITVSVARAAAIAGAIRSHFAWIRAHEPTYNQLATLFEQAPEMAALYRPDKYA